MELLKEIFAAVLALSIAGGALIITVKASTALLRKQITRTADYFLWVVAAVMLLVPVQAFSGAGQSWDTAGRAPQQEEAVRYHYARDFEVRPDSVSVSEAAFGKSAEPERAEFLMAAGDDLGKEAQSSPRQTVRTALKRNHILAEQLRRLEENRIFPLLASLWLAGALAMAAVKGYKYTAYVKKLKETLQPVTSRELNALFDGELLDLPAPLWGRRVEMLCSSYPESPMLVGLAKPLILLPKTMVADFEVGFKTREEFLFVVRHELIHFRRKDVLVKWITQAALCIHWFNPLVWLAVRWMEQSCELSCDEQVCRDMEKEARLRYGRMLLTVASEGKKRQGTVFSTSMGADGKELKERLAVVKTVRQRKPWERALCVGVAALLCVSAVFSVRAMQGEAVNADTAHRREDVTPQEQFVDQLAASLQSDRQNGVIRFTVPEKVPEGYRVWIHMAGRYFLEGEPGAGISSHHFEEENQDNLWLPAVTYEAPVHAANLDDYTVEMGLIALTGEEDGSYLTSFRESGFRPLYEARIYENWQMGYLETVIKYREEQAGKLDYDPDCDTSLFYSLLDVDGDGNPELFLRPAGGETADVYAFEFGRVHYLGSAEGELRRNESQPGTLISSGDGLDSTGAYTLLYHGMIKHREGNAGNGADTVENTSDTDSGAGEGWKSLTWMELTDEALYALPVQWAEYAGQIQVDDELAAMASQWAWAAYDWDVESRRALFSKEYMEGEWTYEGWFYDVKGVPLTPVAHYLDFTGEEDVTIGYLLRDDVNQLYYFRDEQMDRMDGSKLFNMRAWGGAEASCDMDFYTIYNKSRNYVERQIYSWLRDQTDQDIRSISSHFTPVSERLTKDEITLYMLVDVSVTQADSAPVQKEPVELLPAVYIQKLMEDGSYHDSEFWLAAGKEDHEEAVKRGFPEEVLEESQQGDAWLRTEISAKPSEMQGLDDVESRLDEMNRQSEALGDFILPNHDGELVYEGEPLLKPVAKEYREVSQFGYRLHPMLETNKFHSGLDYGAPEGTEVSAAAPGKVLASGWNDSYGFVVILDHGRGEDGRYLATVYAHNSSLLVSQDQTVEQGQLIALSGDSGLSTGAHLHFEVRLDGDVVNPKNYLE